MENEHFGTLLQKARELRRVTLAEVAQRTKLSRTALERIEAGDLDALPPEVFVRGFIRSYARAVGMPDSEPLDLFDKAVEERRRAEEAKYTVPVKPAALDGVGGEDDALHPRRGIGLAVFVIIVLVIATITWSLFLRQPPQSGEGLSRLDVPSGTAPAEPSPRAPAA
jgi:cytoskeletal protein RodZ